MSLILGDITFKYIFSKKIVFSIKNIINLRLNAVVSRILFKLSQEMIFRSFVKSKLDIINVLIHKNILNSFFDEEVNGTFSGCSATKIPENTIYA